MTWEPGPTPEPGPAPDSDPTDHLPSQPPRGPDFESPIAEGPITVEEPPRPRRRLFGAALAFVLVASIGGALWIVVGHSSGNAADNGVATAGGAKSPTATSSPLSHEDQAELARKFNQCMKDQGVDTQLSVAGGDSQGGGPVTIQQSDAPGQGPPVDPKKVDAAMQKCKQYLPNGGQPPKISAEELEQERKYAKCMRANGVPDFPDPNPDGSIRIDRTAGPNDSGTFSTNGMDPNSDAFKRADAKCKQFAPSPPAGARQGGN